MSSDPVRFRGMILGFVLRIEIIIPFAASTDLYGYVGSAVFVVINFITESRCRDTEAPWRRAYMAARW